MKTVVIMRHAKSSWSNSDLSDFDRPLNERGTIDASKMGQRLAEHKIIPDLIVCSSAKRTMKTAQAVAKKIGYPKGKILDEERLYGADFSMIISRIKLLPETAKTVLYVGHNPGITNAVNVLGNASIDNMPTAAIACYKFKVNSWTDILPSMGIIEFLEFPKMFD